MNPTIGTPPNITAKQAAFCRQYLIDMNATQAAIRAGYSKKTARSQAQRMLTNDDISNEVNRLIAERSARVELDADTVLREIMKVALTDIGDAFNVDGSLKTLQDMPVEIRRAIAGVDVFEEFAGRGEERQQIGWTKKIRLWDKLKALELLGRHLKIFSDKIEITGKDGGPVSIESRRPSTDEIAEFSNALFASFQSFRNEDTGEAAELNQDSTASLSEVIADFAAGGDCHGKEPEFTGAMFARAQLIRKNMRPPASFRGETDDD